MKAYLIASGVIFALAVVLHIVRVFADGIGVMDLHLTLLTILAAGMSIWAWCLVPRLSNSDR